MVEPGRYGFGRSLIETNLAYEVGGEVELTFPPDGVVCTVVVPWDQVVSSSGLSFPLALTARSEPTLEQARVLVVEDNGMVASVVARGLHSAKAVVVGPAPRLAAAMELAESAQIDLAILDVDLDGTMVWPVADALARRGVPFLFSTGYRASLVLPPRFADRPVVNKPFRMGTLQSELLRLLAA